MRWLTILLFCTQAGGIMVMSLNFVALMNVLRTLDKGHHKLLNYNG